MRKVWRRLLRGQEEKGRGGAEPSGYKRHSANYHILRNHTWPLPSSMTAEPFSAHMKVCVAHPSCTSQTELWLFSLEFTSQPFLHFRVILHSPCFLLRSNRASKTQTIEPGHPSGCSEQCTGPQCASGLICRMGMNDNRVCDLSWCDEMHSCGYPTWSPSHRCTCYYSQGPVCVLCLVLWAWEKTASPWLPTVLVSAYCLN